MNPIIKWPGGKSREIDKIQPLIPDFKRYVEPFFGGGALFFHLAPEQAVINDISPALMQFYELVKNRDETFCKLMALYADSFTDIVSKCGRRSLLSIFTRFRTGALLDAAFDKALHEHFHLCFPEMFDGSFSELILDPTAFEDVLLHAVKDKFIRTASNHKKSPFSDADLNENLVTGFASGYYLYFRQVLNGINLGRLTGLSPQYKAANFFFIREYCYGSMFRYNANGEFNIPYGGMSYNRKDMRAKIDRIFSREVADLFSGTTIHRSDFEVFLDSLHLTGDDFIFLDPPYDTEFSDYEDRAFTRGDQERLANFLQHTPAKFLLVIKNTDFIRGLYEKDFQVLSFDKQYTYNMRSRNNRNTEHLIIMNSTQISSKKN